MTSKLFKVGDVCKSRDNTVTATVIGFMASGNVVFEADSKWTIRRYPDGRVEHNKQNPRDILPVPRTRIESRWVFLEQGGAGDWWTRLYTTEIVADVERDRYCHEGHPVTEVKQIDFEVPV
jgi:hypothetical protein